MLRYMIIGMPRSRTTWLANLFTTGDCICIHDPLDRYGLAELDSIMPGRYVGISDTSLYLAGPKLLNSYPCRKVIIHRDKSDIEKSLGMDVLENGICNIEGLHVDFNDIDSRIEEIWNYCLDIPFDKERVDLLREFNVQPHFDGMTPPNQEKIANFVKLIDLSV